jgi:hypothetical protein
MLQGENTIILVRRPEPTKNGDHVYRREGVKASVYVNRRIFGKGVSVPDTLTVTAEEPIFRFPADAVDPEVAAAKAERLKARAERSRERADLALEKARKAESNSEKATAVALQQ